MKTMKGLHLLGTILLACLLVLPATPCPAGESQTRSAPCTACGATGRCIGCRGAGMIMTSAGIMPCFCCSGRGRCIFCQGQGHTTVPVPAASGRSVVPFLVPPSFGGGNVSTGSSAPSTSSPANGTCWICHGSGACHVCHGTRHAVHYGIDCYAPCCDACGKSGRCFHCGGDGLL